MREEERKREANRTRQVEKSQGRKDPFINRRKRRENDKMAIGKDLKNKTVMDVKRKGFF